MLAWKFIYELRNNNDQGPTLTRTSSTPPLLFFFWNKPNVEQNILAKINERRIAIYIFIYLNILMHCVTARYLNTVWNRANNFVIKV